MGVIRTSATTTANRADSTKNPIVSWASVRTPNTSTRTQTGSFANARRSSVRTTLFRCVAAGRSVAIEDSGLSIMRHSWFEMSAIIARSPFPEKPCARRVRTLHAKCYSEARLSPAAYPACNHYLAGYLVRPLSAHIASKRCNASIAHWLRFPLLPKFANQQLYLLLRC